MDQSDKSSNSELSTGKSVLKKRKYSFRCDRDNCEKEFQSPSRLEDHIKVFHEGKNPDLNQRKLFACSLCNSKFGLKSRLNRHIKEDHEKQRRQNCSLCSRTFSHIGRLNAHMISFH